MRFMRSNSLKLNAFQRGDSVNVLVATSRQVDHDALIGAQGRSEFGDVGQGVAAFQRRNNAFDAGQVVEALQGFIVGDGDVAAPDRCP
jgi:hypothetical protein